MLTQFGKKLEYAEGRSEFVISAICDIRGFSAFSTHHESPDTAMFIKRFYVKLLDDSFRQAVFAKPMGPTDEVGPGLSNFYLWWKRIQEALDPNGVSPGGGALV
jgi:hypothetical protein